MYKLIGLLFIPFFSIAQTNSSVPSLKTPNPFAGYDFLNRESIYEHSDTLEKDTYIFPQQATMANVKLKNGRLYTNIKALLNLMSNEFIFQDSIGQTYTAIVPIDEVEFSQNDITLKKTVFKTGFPKADDFNENTFFEILSEGKLTFLKAYKISYTYATSFGSTIPIKQYNTKEFLYVFDKRNGMKKISKNKKDILSLFERKEEVLSYMEAHRINVKSETDLIELFNYYNNL